MAVWSSVQLSALSGFRLDAEYYTPQNLRAERAVKRFEGGSSPLSEIADIITDGDHLARDFQESGVLFLTSEHFGEFTINYDSGLYISPTYEQTLARARSEPGAIYLTKTGAHYGKAAVCPPNSPTFNISADVAKIRLKPGGDPYFVALYLNTRLGFSLVRRESTGGTRDRIVLENLRTLRIPNPPSGAQFKKLVERIWVRQSDAHSAIAAAEARLMEALGLDQLDLSPQKTYTRRFKDLQAEARFDAEYFNPKYQRVIKKLRSSGLTLADVAPISQRVFNPTMRERGSTFNYIEIGSLTGDGEADAESLDVADAPSRAKWIVQRSDVITSTVRPIRSLSALIRPEQNGFVCSSGFAVLTPKSGAGGIEPEVLLTYLRLPIICELLDLNCTASMYPAIPEDRLMRVPFVVPDLRTRRAVVEKVRQSIEARREAARLLEHAKKTVEDLIAGGQKRR
ncbi:MAG: hypothetical protein HJJLKODD_02170 [Phycisphaerae bacterium]|nr:hypothetical protein [Phycisphaerae bacterium]